MTTQEKKFADGMIVKTIETKYGDMTKLSFKVEEFIKFLNDNENKGWVNVDIKTSQKGNVYAELNTYKPEEENSDYKENKPVNLEAMYDGEDQFKV